MTATDQLHLNAAGAQTACKHTQAVRILHQRHVRLSPITPIVVSLALCCCSTREYAAPAPEAPTSSVTHKAAPQNDKIARFFPPGIDWSNATPKQISEAVLAAVTSAPENAVELVNAAIDAAKKTGRFPVLNSGESKQCVDPEPKRTLFDVLFPRKRSAQ